MKVAVNQKNFKKALGIVERIVSKNSSLPILNNILLKTENGRLKISATNLEVGINYLIGAKVDDLGEIAVPARILFDFINNLTDEKIALTTKNNILSINSENYKTQILSFNSKDFPIIPKIKNNKAGTISSRALKNCLISVFDCMAISEARPELAGVFISLTGDKITFAATDSFRLSEKSAIIKGGEKISVILPRNTVAELVRISNELENDLEISISENQISFSNDDFELVSRVVDGSYPDYKKVIPEKFISKALIGREEFEKNVKLAGLFSSNISDIKISCFEDKTSILARNSDKGEIETNIISALSNEPFEISLNYRYLLDGLKIISSDKVVVEFTGAGGPVVLKPAEDKTDLVYLIMPLRNQAN